MRYEAFYRDEFANFIDSPLKCTSGIPKEARK